MDLKSLLLDGLIGMVIANYIIPQNRQVEISLAVFHHSARRLSLNIGELGRLAE